MPDSPDATADPALAACHFASGMLRDLGFRHTYTSMKSEACYYVLPGYAGAIRVAAHRFGRTEDRKKIMPVVAALTFGKNQGDKTQHHVEQRVRVALGHYLFARLSHFRSADADPPLLPITPIRPETR